MYTNILIITIPVVLESIFVSVGLHVCFVL